MAHEIFWSFQSEYQLGAEESQENLKEWEFDPKRKKSKAIWKKVLEVSPKLELWWDEMDKGKFSFFQ